jgi:hypothetical protein
VKRDDAPPMPADKSKPIFVYCEACGHEWAAGFLPLLMVTWARVVSSPCPACGLRMTRLGQDPNSTPEADAVAWLDSRDTNAASLTIWFVMMGHRPPGFTAPDIPRDPSDFGRCLRLLRRIPVWLPRLPEIAVAFPEWKPIVNAWDELTALYLGELAQRRYPKLRARMRELTGELSV